GGSNDRARSPRPALLRENFRAGDGSGGASVSSPAEGGAAPAPAGADRPIAPKSLFGGRPCGPRTGQERSAGPVVPAPTPRGRKGGPDAQVAAGRSAAGRARAVDAEQGRRPALGPLGLRRRLLRPRLVRRLRRLGRRLPRLVSALLLRRLGRRLPRLLPGRTS